MANLKETFVPMKIAGNRLGAAAPGEAVSAYLPAQDLLAMASRLQGQMPPMAPHDIVDRVPQNLIDRNYAARVARCEAAIAPGEGVNVFGFYTFTDMDKLTAASSGLLNPERSIRARRLEMDGSNLGCWAVHELKWKSVLLKHGDYAPASVWSPRAARPVPYDLMIKTEDKVQIQVVGLVADSEIGTTNEQRLMVVFKGCNLGSLRDLACPDVSPGKMVIVLGLGQAVVGDEAGTFTLDQQPEDQGVLGHLVLDAIFGDSAATSSDPDFTPRRGETAVIGQRMLELIDVTEISIDTHDLLSTVTGSSSGIPGAAFATEAHSPLFASTRIGQPNTIRVKGKNRAPAPSGSYDNECVVCGAFTMEVEDTCK